MIFVQLIVLRLRDSFSDYYDYYHYYYYCIDRRIDLNLFKSNQSTTGLKAFETCCQWALLYVSSNHHPTISIYCIQKYIYPPVSKNAC